MDVALIPPIEYLGDTYRTNIQLMLPHLADESNSYWTHYAAMCNNPHQYVIMDNGAAEDAQLTNRSLADAALFFGPQEFALPDVMGDGDATFENAKKFLDTWYVEFLDADIKFGYVAHAPTVSQTVGEIQRVHDEFGDRISTIYIPRRLNYDAHFGARRDVLVWLLGYDWAYEYHLFGSSTNFVSEIKIIEDLCLPARSIDTSMPYNRAVQYYTMEDITGPIGRPEEYFYLSFDQDQRIISTQNVDTILEWARA